MHAAGKQPLRSRSASFNPIPERSTRLLRDLKLHGPAGFLLDDHAALTRCAACEEIADTERHDIAASQFAIQCHVEQRQVTQSALNLQSDTDAPNMHGPEREFRAALDGR